MEIKTRGDIILTQGLGLVCKEQRRSGILTSASGLIKDDQVEDLVRKVNKQLRAAGFRQFAEERL
jgi:hypothetical protein